MFLTRLISSFFLIASLATAAPKQVLNLGNGAEPKDLDPHIVTGIPEFHVLQNIFEPLVAKDPKTVAPIPGAAEKWDISKDGKTYTFHLRKNGKWTNGDPVTAEDFVYSWTRLLLPATASEYAAQGYYIKNGKKFNTGELKDASQLGLKAKDKFTLVVTLENPTPYFLSLMYHHSLYPVHKGTVEKYGARWTRPENIVSNGAFSLSKWETNKIITVKKSTTYWGKDSVRLEEVNFYPVEKLDTEEKMFRAGELHVTEQIPLERIPFWQADKSGAYQQYPYNGIYFYWMNVNRKPLDNKLVRQALSLAIDRSRIVNLVTRGGQEPANFFIPPGVGNGYQPVRKLLPTDGSQVKKAKELLEKAGYKDGKKLPPIEILYNTSEAHKKIAEALQAMWRGNLGIEVRLLNQEWKVYLDSQRTHNFDLSRAGWIGDYNDPNTYVEMLGTGNALNHGTYSNKKVDELLVKASKELNAKKRLGIFQEIETILLDEAPVLPIYVYTRVYLRNPKVLGWYPNIEDIHPLKYVSIGE